MKKILLVLTLSLLFLVSCGKKTEEAPKEGAAETTRKDYRCLF